MRAHAAAPVALPGAWAPDAAVREEDVRAGVVRPALSPLLLALAGAWVGVALAGGALLAARAQVAWCGFDARVVCAAALVGALAALALLAVIVGRLRAAGALLALGLAAGAVAGACSASATLAAGDALAATSPAAHVLTVETDARASSSAYGGWRFEATAEGGAHVWVDVPSSVASSVDDLPGMGETVRVTGRWRELDAGEEFDASLLRRGVCLRLSARRIEVLGDQGGAVGAVRAARRGVLSALDPYAGPARALTAGVVCGMQAALASFDASEDFSDLGLSHLVAVSGSHLAVVSALAGALVSRGRARPAARLAVLAALLGVYVAFTGFQLSAIRSWGMAVLALMARVAGRRPHGVSAVALAALLMLLVDPTCAASMGFQLSVLSVLGLSVFAGFAGAWTGELLPRRTPDFARDALALTLVAQAFTAPVCLPAFQTLPVLGPLANVVAAPLVSLLLVLGLACAGLAGVLPSAAPVLLAPCDAVAGAVLAWARALASLPGAAPAVTPDGPLLALLLAAGALGFYVAWPRPSRARALAFLGCVAVVVGVPLACWRFLAPARIVVLDVGQGDAILVQDGAHALLVDTGPDDAVREALAREHVLHLDAVLLTHTDADHAGGLGAVARTVGVDAVLLAQGVPEALANDDAGLASTIGRLVGADGTREVRAGDTVEVGRFELDVVWPRAPVDGADNEDSVVALLTFDVAGRTLSALLTGDAESDVVGPLVQEGAVGRVDVLKAGHHGSAVSTTPEMVAVLDPVLSVASAGENNRYGHPTQACVEAATSRGGAFLCTAQAGDVEVRPAAEGVEVRCARRAP